MKILYYTPSLWNLALHSALCDTQFSMILLSVAKLSYSQERKKIVSQRAQRTTKYREVKHCFSSLQNDLDEI